MHTDFVRNKDGLFINTNVFSEAAQHFEKYGRYTDYLPGTSGYEEFYMQELEKRINGITIGGCQITGDHYNYLNYTRIKKIPDEIGESRSVRKKIGFPNFIDGDYDFFWNAAISEYGCSKEFLDKLYLENIPIFMDGGHNMITAKARRKGYSYKMAAMSANRYDTIPNSIILLCAYETTYLYGRNGIFDMTKANCDWLNKHTAWLKRREKIDTKDSLKASFIEYDHRTGVPIESGFHSLITSVSFHDNPDAVRGVDFTFAAVDEAGRFPNWNKGYQAIVPAQEAGAFSSGFMIVFGTGGDMEGGTIDFSEHFYNAKIYGYNIFENKWDKTAPKPGGYFHPDYIGKEGFIDKHGNSMRQEAMEHRDAKIKAYMDEGKATDARRYMTEHANSPSEAFLRISNPKYPTELIKKHLDNVIREDRYAKSGTPVEVFHDGTKYSYKVITDGSKVPFNEYPIKNFEAGCPVMYIPPSKLKKANIGFSGYDPVNQDHSDHSVSIAAFVIYTPDVGFGSGICLTYWGRPGTAEFNDTIIGLCSLYGIQVMHENMTTQVYNHFDKRQKLHLLAERPDFFLKKVLKKTSSGRTKGCHMNGQIRTDAEGYDRDWMMTPRGINPETGEEILNLHTITDIGLLKEYLVYDGIINTDRVDAVLLMRIHAAESEHIVEAQANTDSEDNVYEELNNYFSK